MATTNRPYPRRTLEQALRIPRALKNYNGGKPWPPSQVADALDLKPKSGNFFYLAGASRDFGLTAGSRDTNEVALTELGQSAVFPQSEQVERNVLRKAFLSVNVFRGVVEHFGGSELPEEKFLANTLLQNFGLESELHEEFIELFKANAKFVGIGPDYSSSGPSDGFLQGPSEGPSSVVVGEPDEQAEEGSPVCFVIMPFTEREDRHETGFFAEAPKQIFSPAATQVGFEVRTAQRSGSDIIQSTIINELLQADIILADLTEHNPNVLFELGFCMAEKKPVALVRAKGTGPIFDVDNMLRVEEYNPNLWKSTVESDLPKVKDHIQATWDNRKVLPTFRDILESTPARSA